MYINRQQISRAYYLFFINIFLKLIPIYLVRKTTLKLRDIYFSFFLIACYLTGAKHCVGIDYGKDSINYGNNILKKLVIKANKIKLLVKSCLFSILSLSRPNTPDK